MPQLTDKSDEEALLPPQNDSETKETKALFTKRRKLQVFATLLLLWTVFFAITDYVTFRIRRVYDPYVVKWVLPTPMEGEVRIPPDVILRECAQWQDDTTSASLGYSSISTFTVPFFSDTLFFLARGLAAGSVTVVHGGDNSDVVVGVKAVYHVQEDLESFRVCTISQEKGVNGLGIFGPQWHKHSGVHFEITVQLPRPAEGPTLLVKDFKTDMPLFVHDIGDLDSSVHFYSIDLKTANMAIRVQSLEAEIATVHTENAAIEGNFRVSSSLKLTTVNSPIDVQVTMSNSDEEHFTTLDMNTANGAIKSVLTLEAVNDLETGGKFKVAAHTANAPLDIYFPDAPVDSVLDLTARTAAGPATVELHKTYEGSFIATTSFLRPKVIFNANEEDPAGKGRRRKVTQLSTRSTVSGSARWSNDEKELGSVSVYTSISPVTLKL
ncbi:hypothetical protein C0991_001892 [Blastosporella zonata]|nr:hypothetical protein C0991_001892 [Blastosporella zonata]